MFSQHHRAEPVYINHVAVTAGDLVKRQQTKETTGRECDGGMGCGTDESETRTGWGATAAMGTTTTLDKVMIVDVSRKRSLNCQIYMFFSKFDNFYCSRLQFFILLILHKLFHQEHGDVCTC